jgi:hypothetical protein
MQMLGFLSVDRQSFLSALRRGRSVGLVPGGISEMFLCSHGNDRETLAVRNRKGFVKVSGGDHTTDIMYSKRLLIIS